MAFSKKYVAGKMQVYFYHQAKKEVAREAARQAEGWHEEGLPGHKGCLL